MADSTARSSNIKSTLEIIFALDSGATSHFVNDASIFSEISTLQYSKDIFVAKSEQSILVSEIGTVVDTSCNGVEITLKNVLVSTEFRENLLSVSKML